jgi:LPXTG-motif cell wall-anchored protein
MIDATDHLCPYCGADTDAILAPYRAALPIVVVALLALTGVFVARTAPTWALAVVGGAIVGLALGWYLRRRR